MTRDGECGSVRRTRSSSSVWHDMRWPFRKKVVIRPEISSPTTAELRTRVAAMSGRGATDTTAWQIDTREESTMPDRTETPTEDLINPYGPPDVITDGSGIPVSDSGIHETSSVSPSVPCPTCFGTGNLLTTNDLLRRSLTLLGDDPKDHHSVVAEFYLRLLTAAPGLVTLFPPDLTDPFSSGEGKQQRDLLLGALLDIGQLYDPDHPDSDDMQTLDRKIEVWGRRHNAFNRPDGTVRPASLKEYGAVFDLLMGTLHDATGSAWVPVFDEVWEQAYDHTARGMIAAAWSSRFKSARYPRA
jgi:hemoglobin-like flavoprotein